MNETELSRLIVRLTGDGSDFQKMLNQAQESAAHTAKAIEEHGSKIEKIGESIKSVGENTVRALEAFGVMEWLREGFKDFERAEVMSIRLNAAIRMGGHDVAETSHRYKEFAESIAEATMQSKGQVLQLLRAAEVQGLSGDKAEAAAKKAIALAGSQGGEASPQHMLRLVNAMEQGNIKLAMSYGRMVEGLKHVRDESQFVAMYQKLLNTGWATANEEANSTAGKVKRAAEAYEHFKQSLGAIVADAIGPFLKGLGRLAEALNKLPKENKIVIVSILGLMSILIALKPILVAVKYAFWAIFSPVLPLAAVAAAGMYLWAQSIGGVSKAWTILKNTAVEAMIFVEYAMEHSGDALQLAQGKLGKKLIDWNTDFLHTLGVITDAQAAEARRGGEQLKKNIDDENRAVREGYGEYRSRRLKEFASGISNDLANGMGTGAEKGLKKIEGVLSGSAEARSRIAEYLEVGRKGNIHDLYGGGKASSEQTREQANHMIEVNRLARERLTIEKTITDYLKDQGRWMNQQKNTFLHSQEYFDTIRAFEKGSLLPTPKEYKEFNHPTLEELKRKTPYGEADAGGSFNNENRAKEVTEMLTVMKQIRDNTEAKQKDKSPPIVIKSAGLDKP